MTQHYARLYDATLKRQFESATEVFEGILIRDWPVSVAASETATVELQNSANSV